VSLDLHKCFPSNPSIGKPKRVPTGKKKHDEEYPTIQSFGRDHSETIPTGAL